MPFPTATWRGVTDALTEQPESGLLQRKDQTTYTQVFRGPYALCISSAPAKGTIGIAPVLGWRCQESTVTREQPGGKGILNIVWQAGPDAGGIAPEVIPDDEWSCVPEPIQPKLSKHAMFAALTDADWHLIKDYLEASTKDDQGSAEMKIDGLPGGRDVLAAKYIKKYLAGGDGYYLAGLRYTWVSRYLVAPFATLGGTLGRPGGPGAGYLPPTTVFLRQADQLEKDGRLFKLTRIWIGGPAGHWDTDLYPAG